MTGRILAKEILFQARSPSFKGKSKRPYNATYLTGADQEIPDWSETSIKLGIKSWWVLAQVTPF